MKADDLVINNVLSSPHRHPSKNVGPLLFPMFSLSFNLLLFLYISLSFSLILLTIQRVN